MRTLRCIAPLFVVVACGTKQSVPPPKASLHQSALDSWARPLVQDEWFAGISVSLIHDGEVEHFGYGHASDAGEPITAKTRFEMGSVSKVFTSVLLADQVLQSKLTLDTPVQDLLPAGNTVKGGTVPITLRHLVTHTSGLPRMPANFAPKNPADPFADYTPGLLYAYLASTPLEHAAGTRYDYSNTGAGLVGHVISLSTGQSYDQLVVNRVAMPLGMADTRGAHTPGLPVAQGHRADGSATPVWNWDALAGAGAVVSNGQDMARFVQAAMNPPQTPVGRALAMTLEAQPSAPQQRMAMGWHVGLGAGPADQTRWHNGQTHGFHTFVAVDAATHTGVVLLANQEGMLLDKLGIALMARLRGQPAEFAPPATVVLPVETLSAYVGTYALTPTVSVQVTVEGTALFAQLTGQPKFRIFARAPDAFYFRVAPAELLFTRDAAGAVTGLTLNQGGKSTPAPRTAP